MLLVDTCIWKKLLRGVYEPTSLGGQGGDHRVVFVGSNL